MPFSRRPHPLQLVAVLFTILVAGLFSVYLYQSRPNHFLQVEEGVLYRSGTLRAYNLESVLRVHGIRTVVNLRPIDEKNPPGWYVDERAVCKKLDVLLVDLPMKPETPPNAEQVGKWLALLKDPDRLPILVHCKHGVVRTGMLVAVFQAEFQGKSNSIILEDLPMFGHRLWVEHRKPMRQFILNYSPRGQSAPVSQ